MDTDAIYSTTEAMVTVAFNYLASATGVGDFDPDHGDGEVDDDHPMPLDCLWNTTLLSA